MFRCSRPCTRIVATLVVIGLSAGAAQAELMQVIYTSIAGHPTAAAPGLVGFEFSSIGLSLYGSPDGNRWIFKAFINDVSAANDIIVVGSETSGTTVAKEGDASPIGGRIYGFMDSDCGINDSGQYAFGNRLDAPTTDDEVIFYFDGVNTVAAAREGDPAPGLIDSGGPAGDELFGNSLNSMHVLADGRVAFRADLIQNIATANRSALYIASTPVAQEGTMAGSGETYDSFIALSGDTFSVDPSGTDWIVEADVDPTLTSVEAAVLTGFVQIKDGDTIGSLGAVDNVFAVDIAGNGDWYVRGDNATDDDWAVRNGTLIAATGDPIFPSATENWAPVIHTATGNSYGDYIVIGQTDNVDPNIAEVVVLNGEDVVLRRGELIDLDGDGTANDDAFLGAMQANDAILSGGRFLYVFAEVRDSLNTDLGDGFLRVKLPGSSLPGDLNCDGEVNNADIPAMVLALTDPDGYGTTYPDCELLRVGDVDDDGSFNNADIPAFVALLTGG